MRRWLINPAATTLCVMLLSACSGGAGFEGNWVEIEYSGEWPDGVSVEAEGDHYLWIDDDGTYVARIDEEGALRVDTGFGDATAVLVDGEMIVRAFGDEWRFQRETAAEGVGEQASSTTDVATAPTASSEPNGNSETPVDEQASSPTDIAGGAGSAAAATVGGADISVSEVRSLRVTSAPTGADFAADLNNLISNTVVTRAAQEQFGIVVTDEDRQAQVDLVTAQIESGGSTVEASLGESGLTDEFLQLFANQEAVSSQVREALGEELDPPTAVEIQEVYATELATYEEQVTAQQEAYELQLKFVGMEVCSSHVLLDTQEDADAALVRLEAGEAFADLAVELSTGPSGPTGGDLGCASLAGFVAEFAEAVAEGEIGVPIGPVETEFGFHVILVTSRDVDQSAEAPVAPEIPPFPKYEESEAGIKQNLVESAIGMAFQDWFTEVLRSADVTVSEQFGTWTVPDDGVSVPQVTPPLATP